LHDIISSISPYWFFFSSALKPLNTGKSGNAKEDDGDEHEKGEKQTGDEGGREQLIAGKDATRKRRRRGNRRRFVLAPRACQKDEVAWVGTSNLLELTRKASLW
jgi:hypothetical protein